MARKKRSKKRGKFKQRSIKSREHKMAVISHKNNVARYGKLSPQREKGEENKDDE